MLIAVPLRYSLVLSLRDGYENDVTKTDDDLQGDARRSAARRHSRPGDNRVPSLGDAWLLGPRYDQRE